VAGKVDPGPPSLRISCPTSMNTRCHACRADYLDHLEVNTSPAAAGHAPGIGLLRDGQYAFSSNTPCSAQLWQTSVRGNGQFRFALQGS